MIGLTVLLLFCDVFFDFVVFLFILVGRQVLQGFDRDFIEASYGPVVFYGCQVIPTQPLVGKVIPFHSCLGCL